MDKYNKKRIADVEAILNYGFHDKAILLQALRAGGAQDGQKRLALIGDAALTLVLYENGYKNCSSIDDMTLAQSTRATNKNLAEIGTSVGLGAHIQHKPSLCGVAPMDLMATAVKAIIGAVYIDSTRDISVIHHLVLRAGDLVNALM